MLQSIDLISITQIRDLDFRNRVSHRVVFFLLFLLKSQGPTQLNFIFFIFILLLYEWVPEIILKHPALKV